MSLSIAKPRLARTLYGYILTNTLRPVLTVGTVLVLLVWLIQNLRFLDLLVNKGLPLLTFLELTAYLLPFVLTFVLPLALLIGMSQACRNLHETCEWPPLYSAGLSHWQLLKPFMLLAVLGVAIGYALSLYMLPVGMQNFKSLQHQLRHQQGHLLLETGTFNQLEPGLMVYLHQRVGTYGMKGLFVHDSRNPDHTVTWLAASGELEITSQGIPRLMLQQGVRQDITPQQTTSLSFQSHALELGTPVQTPPKRILSEEERMLTQLTKEEAESPDIAREFSAEWHKRLLWPLTPLPLMLFAAGLLLRPRTHRGHLGWPLTGVGIAVIAYQVGLIVFNSAARDGAQWALYGQWAFPILTALTGLILMGTRRT